MAQSVNNPPTMQETPALFDSWVRKIPWRRDRLPIPVFLGPPGGSVGKESTCTGGDMGSIPGLGRSPEEGKGYLLQYSGLENSLDCIVHGVAASGMAEQLSLSLSLVAQSVKNPPTVQETWVRSLGWEDPLEEGMATHSSILAWRIHAQRSLAGCSP